MIRPNSRAVWSSSLAACIACGEPPAPVSKPPVAEATGTASAVVVVDPPPEAPAAPESLVLVLRARNPEQTWKIVRALHPAAIDLAKELSVRSDDASRFMSLAEPWDVGVVLDPQWERVGSPRFLTAVSIPLGGDVEGFLSLVEEKGDSVSKLAGGRYRIVSGESLRCEVWTGGGVGRMVCSDGAPALGELGAWMALTLATEPKPAEDLTLRIRMAPLRAPYAAEGARSIKEMTRALELVVEHRKLDGADLLTSLEQWGPDQLKNTLDDLEELTASIRLQANDPALTLSGKLRWRSNTSLFTQVVSARLTPTEPPAEFWRLPKDAEVAFYGRGVDEQLLVGPRAVIRRVVGLSINLVGMNDLAGPVTAKDRSAYLRAFDKLPLPTGPWAFAVGSTLDLAQGRTAGDMSPKSVVAEAERRIAAAVGWSVFAGEGDAALLTSSVKTGLEALDTHIKRSIKEFEQYAGKSGSRGGSFFQARKEALERTAPKWKFTKDPIGYPKGSGLFDITFGFDNTDVRDVVDLDESEEERAILAGKRAFALGKIPVKLVVVPGDAGGVVWGVSVDGDTLRKKLLASLSGATMTDTLAARTDLGALREKPSSGGFMHVGPTLARLMMLDPQDNDVEELRDVLGAMPSKATGRAVFASSGQEGEAPTMNFTVALDRSLTIDLLSLP